MMGIADVGAAASNLYSTTVGGGLADLRRMPSTVIDSGPQRTLSRYHEKMRDSAKATSSGIFESR